MLDGHSSLDRAMHDLVHSFPGGARKLAPLARMNPGTLSNKVNPSCEGHHLTVDEAVALQHAAGDFRILEAEAAALGHVAVRLGDFRRTSDVELLDKYAELTAEHGETAGAIRRALRDRRITPDELAEIRREIFEDARVAFEFLSRLEAIAE